MERVLPWPGPSGSGWGNLHWSLHVQGVPPDKGKRWRGAPFKTADELVTHAQKLTMAPPHKAEDIYFCTSIQSQTDTVTMPDGRTFAVASRHAETATLIKAIFLDVDIKDPPKGYTNLNEALDAINTFVAAAGLPGPSALVLSGGGVHVYWISGRPLSIAEWRPFAEGLKAQAMRLGLRADYGVTADPARILRVPGTFNRKIAGTPRAVKVLGLGRDYDFATDLAGLATIGTPLVTATVTKAAPFDMSAFAGQKMNPLLAVLNQETDKLSDGIKLYNDLPLDPTNVFKECPHFRDSIARGGQGQGQGLWMLTVLASTWFENGRDFAHAMSDKYPSYDEDETDAMFDRKMGERAKGLGWPSCKSIENEGSKHCAGCKYKPLGKSPLNLADRVKDTPPAPSNVAAVNPAKSMAVVTGADLELPDGYVLSGGKICYVPEPDPDSEEPPKPEPIFYGYVVAKPWTSNSIPPTLHFKYRQGVNNAEITVPYNRTNSDTSLQDCLSGQTVMTQNDKVVRRFMKSWIARIDEAYKRLTSAPFGWVTENGIMRGFAYGGKLFLTSGAEEDAGYPHKSIQADYSPTGSIDHIYKALEILSEHNHPALEVLALQSWASPLLHYAGLKASICWGWSNLSAAFKSSSIRTGMALWASPDRAREQKGLTAAGLETKLDNLKNLPLVIDEITDDEMLDALLPAIQTVPEGGAGTRSTRTGEQRPKKTWAAALVCGSNTSMHEHQLLRGAVTDAKAARVFEFRVEKREGKRNETEVNTLIASLDDNFGHLGLAYAKYLAVNYASLKDRYKAIADGFEAEKLLAPVGKEERYWKATCAITLLAAEIANEVTGKDFFHPDQIRKFLIDTFVKNRNWVATYVNVAGEATDSEQTMMMVLDQFMNNTLVTDGALKRGDKKKKLIAVQMPPANAGHGNPVHVQWVVEPALLRISLPALKDFLTTKKVGVNRIEDMRKIYGGEFHRKVNMMAGLDLLAVTKARVDVWEMAITEDHPLHSIWHAKAHHAQSMTIAVPATGASAAAQAQDEALITGIVAQAAKDMAVVTGATGAHA